MLNKLINKDSDLNNKEKQRRIIVALKHYRDKDPEDTIAETALSYLKDEDEIEWKRNWERSYNEK
tara:strand:- start:797 stop:991 length:195 start_codon:yes stop_codon:yes gene_type:complete